ncbi:hypothetical protein Taro_035109 [Colocasia esculenta]|uniref:Uncharacterized protein n=1 Tax=Colocasia esculenta TaxID=4460 RepID=A0A843VY56_COLES|nr:hypothetical protein [Colocasia esculenta]
MAIDSKGVKDGDFVDLERGTTTGDNGSGISPAKQLFNKICNGLTGAHRSIRDEEAANLVNPIENKDLSPEKKFGEEEGVGLAEKAAEAEQPKKKKKPSKKKPPKPPRPPRAASLDALDQKLTQEISELAMLKRARVERMKALMKTKNSKSTSSNSNLFALIITLLFCLVIIWQGFCSRSHSKVSLVGSPESSIGTRAQLLSVQYFRNVASVRSLAWGCPFYIKLRSIVERFPGVGWARRGK